MPNRKLETDTNAPGDFSISPERGNRGFKVKANHQKYDVWQKDISENIPDSAVDPDDGQTKSITWIANFGMKLKGKQDKDSFEQSVDPYTIEIDDVEGVKYVYFDGKDVKFHENVKRQSGKASITFHLGDPDTGHMP